jgi:hypothetical protein
LKPLYQQVESIHVLINTKNYYYGQIEVKIDITYVHRQQFVQEMKLIKKIVDFFPDLFRKSRSFQ